MGQLVLFSIIFSLYPTTLCGQSIVTASESFVNVPPVKLATQHSYRYESHFQSKCGSIKADSGRNCSFSAKISAKVYLRPLWASENITLSHVQIEDFVAVGWKSESPPADLDFDKEKVETHFLILADSGENSVDLLAQSGNRVNFHYGLASLLQVKTRDWHGHEIDVKGRCETSYRLQTDGIIRKKRENCVKTTNRNSEKILGSTVEDSFSAKYKLTPDGVIESADADEWLIFRQNMWPEVDQVAQQKVKLLREGKSEVANVLSGLPDVETVLGQLENESGQKFVRIGSGPGVSRGRKAPKLKAVISSNKKYLKEANLATPESARAHLALVKSIEAASSAQVMAVLNDKSNVNIMPQLVDAVGASGHIEAHLAVISKFSHDTALIERYLWALAQEMTPAPPEIAEKLLSMVQSYQKKDDKIAQTIALTLGKLSRKSADVNISVSILSWLVNKLTKCKSSDCIQVYAGALKNAESPAVAPILLALTEAADVDRKAKILALEAVEQAGLGTIDDLADHLLSLLLDPAADLSVKAMAADLVVKSSLTSQTLDRVVQVLVGLRNRELLAILLQKWNTEAVSNPQLSNVLRSKRWNWDILAHGGTSTSFGNQLAKNLAGNSSFKFVMESDGLVFKRSHFQLNFDQPSGLTTNLVELNIFAGGLASYMISDGVEGDDPEPNAGMRLKILGNQLRPFVFFESTNELINLYWSGAAEQKTSAIQGNILLQRQNVSHIMSNGFQVSVESLGAVSYDISGKADISLWGKTSDSVIENALAYVMETRCQVSLFGDEPIVQESNIEASVNFNVETSIDLSESTPKMCIRVDRPGASIVQTMQNGDEKQRQLTRFPGKTLFLTAKNNELCNKMFPKN